MDDEYDVDLINLFHERGLDLDTRSIWLGSVAVDAPDPGVDFRMAETFCKNILILDQGDQPITIYLNSGGGYVYEGFAIYDAIKACKNQTTIVVMGSAMSMGAIILQAADRRVMMPNSTLMIHIGQNSFSGHAIDFQRAAEETKRCDLLCTEILSSRSGLSVSRLNELQQHDTFLSAHDAVKMGFADSVYEKRK